MHSESGFTTKTLHKIVYYWSYIYYSYLLALMMSWLEMNVEQLLFHLTEHVIYHVDPNQGFLHLVNPQLVPEIDSIINSWWYSWLQFMQQPCGQCNLKIIYYSRPNIWTILSLVFIWGDLNSLHNLSCLIWWFFITWLIFCSLMVPFNYSGVRPSVRPFM